MPDVVPPWAVGLTDAEHDVVLFGLAAAGLALLAMLLRSLLSVQEVGPRYRPAMTAAVSVVALAFVSYVLITAFFLAGYRASGGVWLPNRMALWSWAFRYADWAVTIPLLVAELVAVSALMPRRSSFVRLAGGAMAVLMVLSGFVGGVVVDGGRSFAALLGFGVLGGVFFVVLYVLIITTVVRSLPSLPLAARRSYRGAMVLLVVVWFAYPVVFGMQGLAQGGTWTAVEQLVFSAADVVAKIGYGALIIRVAKLRTAADVRDELDVHPESIWVDRLKQSDAVAPVPLDADGAPSGRGPRSAQDLGFLIPQDPERIDETG